jgi:hypothetical protein
VPAPAPVAPASHSDEPNPYDTLDDAPLTAAYVIATAAKRSWWRSSAERARRHPVGADRLV